VDLLVVRHAIAEDREAFATSGRSDELRPLTERGHARMVEAARGLARVVETVNVLATSPYTRSRETASILSEAFGGVAPVAVDALTPEAEYRDLTHFLRQQARNDTVAIVGHEPHLSGFIRYLLTGQDEGLGFVQMKKGSVCMLELSDPVRPNAAVLRWLLTPAHLRKLAALPPEAGPA
jgi:phosphohistidine phosphatase